MTQDEFDALLAWLDPNRDLAPRKYKEIRRRIVRILVCRGFKWLRSEAMKHLPQSFAKRRRPRTLCHKSRSPISAVGLARLDWTVSERGREAFPVQAPYLFDED